MKIRISLLTLLVITSTLLGRTWQVNQGRIGVAERERNSDKVKGETAEKARGLLGTPNRTARQVLYRRYLEQWFYDEPAGFWIELDCLKGQDPRVTEVHKQ